MISSVITQSFKKIDNGEFYFEAGSNVITGENGAGKSTLLKAIRFALFGASASGSPKDSLPTHGSKNCQVELNISDLKIVRDLKNCTIYRNGEIVAQGSTPSTSFIEKELGMDFKAFNLFCLSPQGETQALLTLGAAEINRKVEQYSGITLIDQVLTKARSDASIYKAKLDELTLTDILKLETVVLSLEAQLSGFDEVIAKSRDYHKILSSECDNLSAEITEKTLHNQKVSNAKQMLDSAKVDLARLKQQLTEYQDELFQLNKTDYNKAVIEEDINTLEGQLKRVALDNNHFRDQQAKKGRLEREIEELRELVDVERNSIAKIEVINRQLQINEPRLAEVMQKLSDLNHSFKSARSLLENGVCSECKRPHEDFDLDLAQSRYRKIKTEIDKVSEEKYDLENIIAKDNELLRKHRANVQGYNDKLSHKLELDNQLFVKLSVLELIPESKIDGLRNQLAQKKHELANFEKIERQIEKRNKQVEETLSTISAKQKSLSEYMTASELPIHDLSNLETKLKKYRTDRDETLNKLQKMESEKSGFESDLSHAKQNLQRAEEDNDKYKSAAHELAVRTDLIKLLRDKRQSFMTEIWGRILHLASSFVEETTGGWIVEILRDDKGNFNYRESGQKVMPILGNASGAQAAFCGAAIRVAIAQALHGRNALLMLDEPTESMSEENASRLASGLTRLGGQTILITHRKSEAFTANNVIEL